MLRQLLLLSLSLGFTVQVSAQSTAQVSAQSSDSLEEYRSGVPADEEYATGLVKFFTESLDPRSRASNINEAKRHVPSRWRDEASFLYATALVQLSKRSDDALKTLEQARGTASEPYYPSWKALIIQRFRRREYSEGFRLIEELAALETKSKSETAGAAASHDHLKWLGLVLGGLKYGLTRKANLEQLQKTSDKVEKTLSNEQLAAFQSGLATAIEQHDAILGSLNQSEQEDAANQSKQNEVKQQELKDEQENIIRQKQDLELTAEEYEKKMVEYNEEFQKKIGALQEQFNKLNNLLIAQSATIASVERELSELNRRKSQFRDKNGNQITVSSDPDFVRVLRDINNTQQRLSQYRSIYNQTYAKTQVVYNNGMREMARQNAIVAEYKERTGKILKQDQTLARSFEKIADTKESLQNSDSKKDSPATRNLRREAKSLNAYAPFDVQEECQRLILALKPTDPEENSGPAEK